MGEVKGHGYTVGTLIAGWIGYRNNQIEIEGGKGLGGRNPGRGGKGGERDKKISKYKYWVWDEIEIREDMGIELDIEKVK